MLNIFFGILTILFAHIDVEAMIGRDDPILFDPPSLDPNLLFYYLTPKTVKSLERLDNKQHKIGAKLDFSVLKYYLWTPENGPDKYFEFNNLTPAETLLKNNFKPDRVTKFLCHGWRSNGRQFSNPFVPAYFSQGFNVNIIAVDHSDMESWSWNYYRAASSIDDLGLFIGVLFSKRFFVDLKHLPDKIHVIGHSLGGHLAGHFGRQLSYNGTKLGIGKIARVTALDPAGPWFSVSDDGNSVHRTDANLVDVIHTNSGPIYQGKLSLEQSCGLVDFYPNGGSKQPGCDDQWCLASFCFSSSLIDIFNGACSHDRSIDYYVESILNYKRNDTFVSTACDSWESYQKSDCKKNIKKIQMGENLSLSKLTKEMDGNKFFLVTNSKPPYAFSDLPTKSKVSN